MCLDEQLRRIDAYPARASVIIARTSVVIGEGRLAL